LNHQQWVTLWAYLGQDPPDALDPDAGLSVPKVYRDVIGLSATMAYITSRNWTPLYWNPAFTTLFHRGQVPGNIMGWMAESAAAKEILVDWPRSWGPMIMPQLRAAHAAYPDDEILRRLVKNVRQDPLGGPIYDRGGETVVHPDGDERPFCHPVYGLGTVTMAASEPLGAHGARLMSLIYRRRGDQFPMTWPLQ
ncbi:MAG: hypothetical protein JWO67_6286, partial [Streptosporangiaceae bacterium]|nr:hypothetical protein [Streptosporangiaceae bacterium]